MENKVNKFVYWAPRVASIIFILFLAMFSLDVFEGDSGFWRTILAFFIHNIPVIIFLAVLIISWKREIIGGIAFILAGILYIGFILVDMIKSGFEWFYLVWALQISGIAFFIGILFIVNWIKKHG